MKTLKDFNLKNKRVLVRVDFNVPLDEKARVLDNFRIGQVVPTIKYLKERGAKTILMSHLGDEPKRDKKNSLQKISLELQNLLGQQVIFLKDCIGKTVEDTIIKMSGGEVALLENLRFYEEEKQGDLSFAKKLARTGEFFLNDAFSVCHRSHASVVGVANFLTSGAGQLLEKELGVLSGVLKEPVRPLLIILGGAKVDTKIKAIPPLLEKADHIILGGLIAEAVLRVKGVSLREALPSKKTVEIIKNIDLTSPKLHLPIDVITVLDGENDYQRKASLGKIRREEMALDIGEDSVKIFSEVISEAKTIVWAGPLGLFEKDKFAKGTRAVAEAILNNKEALKIAGGGDTNLALKKFDLRDKFDFVSTGGSALLEYLSGQELPGLAALENPRLALNIKNF